MRVIEHGKHVGTVETHETVCPYCGCRFAFGDDDLGRRYEGMFNKMIVSRIIKCPECDMQWIYNQSVKMKTIEQR